MAATAEGAALTEAHRLAQVTLANDTTVQLLQIWPLLDPVDLDGTARRWLTAAVPIIERARGRSASISAAYLRQFRATELHLPVGDLALPPMPQLAPAAIETSLLVTGPVEIRRATGAGTTISSAAEAAAAAAARAGTRQALTGGRDLATATIIADPRATGYRRITKAQPCYFCAMVASRGAVYLSRDTAGFRPHDGCYCQPEPAYEGVNGDTAHGDAFAELWKSSTAGVAGSQAQVNAFRRALEAQRT